MSDKIISFEEQLLKNKLTAYADDLRTNYLIVKRKEPENSETEVEMKMEQYDLFHMQTHEPYMEWTVFPDLRLAGVKFAQSAVVCALTLDPNRSITKYQTISIDEIEEMISYIQFTKADLYSDTLESLPERSLIKESPFHKDYLHSLTAIQYCMISIAKLYV